MARGLSVRWLAACRLKSTVRFNTFITFRDGLDVAEIERLGAGRCRTTFIARVVCLRH